MQMIRETESLNIKGTPEEIYNEWWKLENFPRYMTALKSVEWIDAERSHWIAKGPLGTDVEWTAEITRDDINRRIGWKTVAGDIKTSGQVTFNALPQGFTEVTVVLHIEPPAGALGEAITNLFQNPQKILYESLYNFKNYFEGRQERLPENK
jgi:uncharacterized membrane protein